MGISPRAPKADDNSGDVKSRDRMASEGLGAGRSEASEAKAMLADETREFTTRLTLAFLFRLSIGRTRSQWDVAHVCPRPRADNSLHVHW